MSGQGKRRCLVARHFLTAETQGVVVSALLRVEKSTAEGASRYIEILHMKTTTSAHVSLKLKAICARYGIPDVVVSNDGPQFTSTEFQDLARELDFEHVTSSPHSAQRNGHAERAVQTTKRILKQKDPLIALMCYRSTPCSTTGASPAVLLMGRKIRTTLPTLERNLQPS